MEDRWVAAKARLWRVPRHLNDLTGQRAGRAARAAVVCGAHCGWSLRERELG